ncbi:hypothetical protein Nepgr_007008 [Nepenthes gracilis]|uniref:Methyltransferase type 11 domain-containing protein n=1 Tax=Nepenthes gracilis TaxID=150966 RepID=A0AAD3S659_NEPGR|nr:hypothetical protein Nepgr_007008 [Nepenthes gracilis]
MAMGLTMGLNMLLLLAMVAANLLSLYHLSSTLQSRASPPPPVPDHLIRQLNTIRATINHLTRLQPPPTSTIKKPSSTATAPPPDLLLFAHLSPVASSCHDHPHLLHQYMNYIPFSLCPHDFHLAESLILRGCHPLPRRRCFSLTPSNPGFSLSSDPFPTSLPDSNVIWSSSSTCRSFKCLNPKLGFDMAVESQKFLSYKSELDLTISQLVKIMKSSDSILRLGLDIGGGTGTFAARMREKNVTVITTTMNLGAPYSEAAALRGLVPLHVPLQQRLPVFDGVVDLVRCGHVVNRWIPVTVMEFLFYDVDRVLRGGGFLWLDHFFSKGVDLEKVYKPLIGRLGSQSQDEDLQVLPPGTKHLVDTLLLARNPQNGNSAYSKKGKLLRLNS